MPGATAIMGTQWGDEGKGKVVDLLAARADMVVRWHGGNNAGHTLVVNGEKTVLNLIPSGVLHPGKICVLGAGMVIDPEILVREITGLRARGYLESLLGEPPIAVDEILEQFRRYRDQLAPFVADTGAEVRAAVARGARVLLEGAQGVLLDVDHGTYPFVTSSSCVPGGACAGAGLPGRMIGRIIGIAKAYTTRVGGGPFPSELRDALGERLRADGDEYGATTGRPRRCGWFDAVVVRHSVALSGLDALALTKLDVLTGIDPLRICVAYEIDGQRVDRPPATQRAWAAAKPIYEEVPGWQEGLGHARTLDELPAAARRYIDRLSAAVEAPVALVSVGAAREETIRLGEVF